MVLVEMVHWDGASRRLMVHWDVASRNCSLGWCKQKWFIGVVQLSRVITIIFTMETSTSDRISLGTDLFL